MDADILYLDYDPEFRELAKMYLEREDFDVRTHGTPEEELDCYQGEPVVVTDYRLEGQITGVDVAEALGDEAHVIMYTGYEKDRVESEIGTELPENTQFLTKGGGFEEVVEKVKQAIER
jgi:DNA-binding NtrC family response regulator